MEKTGAKRERLPGAPEDAEGNEEHPGALTKNRMQSQTVDFGDEPSIPVMQDYDNYEARGLLLGTAKICIDTGNPENLDKHFKNESPLKIRLRFSENPSLILRGLSFL